MGVNYYLVSQLTAVSLREMYYSMKLHLNETDYQEYEKYNELKDNSDIIHIGRRTNGIFIWNINPETLKKRLLDCESLEIWHESGAEEQTSSKCIMTYNEFIDNCLQGSTFDLSNAGKGYDFF